ncbi:protein DETOXIFICATION 49 [Silene latifolia]|uniref:protein DETOXIFICATION 49 n=1 Tax=Silene latifolia TaxID=37657 RepID=UPI003D7885EC
MCNKTYHPVDTSVTVRFFEPETLHSPLLPKSPTPTTKISPISLPQNNHHIKIISTPHTKISKDEVKNCYNNYPCLPSSIQETKLIADIALPMILTGLLVYSKSMISTMFLGRLGDLALAGGSLALGFANITGYSLLSGLAMGMEPICGQAYGAKRHALLGLTLHRTILLLLLASLPISMLWLNMEKILLLCRQDRAIAAQAQAYLLYSLPDLFAQSIIHPLRIYLRTQSITFPLTLSAALAIGLHLPINWLMIVKFKLGVKGVAIAGVITNFNMIIFLVIYMVFSDSCKKGWAPVTKDSFRGFSKLLKLAIPSCISVCLEWWWYEIMILLCGLLPNPKLTVASMGILIQTTSLIYVFPSSLSVSVSTRVGNELGAGRPKRAKRAATMGLFFSFLLGISAVFFTFSVRKKWANLFTNDEDIIKLTALVLPVIGLCELGNCPQTTGCGVLRGTARPKVGANINLGCFYLVGMPVALWLGFVSGFGFRGLWLGLLAAQASCVVVMMIVIYKTDWENEAERADQLTDHDYDEQQAEKSYKQDHPILV